MQVWKRFVCGVMLGLFSLTLAWSSTYDELVWHNGHVQYVVIHHPNRAEFEIQRTEFANQPIHPPTAILILSANVTAFEEEYLYSFLSQIFNLTSIYTNTDHDPNPDCVVHLCQSNSYHCVRVSTQLFEHQGGRFVFDRYMQSLSWPE